MQTLYYPSFDTMELNDQPIPDFGNDEVLLKVAACGICGSELEAFKNRSVRRTPPLIMGHEFAGTIEALGENVSGFYEGQKVVSNSVISCGNCSYCTSGITNLCPDRQIFGMQRNGAFAEYVNVPAESLLPMPLGLDFKEACLAEPLANGVHMVELTRHIKMDTVMVIGAGPIGLMAQMAFQAMRNVPVIVSDVNSERLEVAKSLGAVSTINPMKENIEDALATATAGAGVSLIIDAVGMEATSRQALTLLRNGGALVVIGLHENGRPFHSYDIVLNQKQIIGSYAATRQEMETALNLMQERKVDATSWIHFYPLQDGITAFNDMLKPAGKHIKAVLVMDQE